MSPDALDQHETEVRRPRGWILCLLYGLAAAPLMAGDVVLIDTLVFWFLGSHVGVPSQVVVILVKAVWLPVTLFLVFLVFRRLYALKRLKLVALGPLYFASSCWVVGLTAFSYAVALGLAETLSYGESVLDNVNWVMIFIALNLVGSFALMTFLEQDRPEPEDGTGTVRRS